MEEERFKGKNLFDLHGRVALVTGGTSGIGFMMAQGLIVNGIETLFVTGYESLEVHIRGLSNLQGLAKNRCKVLGYLSTTTY
jgi:NAD(P)-dependent dehydrogenase (short-subunit alcohol dehydrogenase family)